MRRPTPAFATRHRLHLILPCALVALVGVLATLQYRWVGQIAAAERQRMRASAQARARQFAEEFDAELGRLSLAFAQPPQATALGAGPARSAAPLPVPPADPTTAYPAEFARWKSTTAHPELVRALYLSRVEEGVGHLSKLSNSGQFEPAEWPADLTRLRAHIEASGNGKLIAFAPAAPDAPALVLPVARVQVSDLGGADGHRVRIMNVVGVAGILIVQLNSDYIERQWLPALARRYFAAGGDFDYNVAVFGSADGKREASPDPKTPGKAEGLPYRNRRLVYVSDARLSRDVFAAPDVAEAFFQVGTERGVTMTRPLSVQKIVVGQAAGDQAAGSAPALDTLRFAFSARRDVPGGDGTAAGGSSSWQLRLVHRAGSLEAAIAQSRRRNLAVSFGILALLGISLGLIVLSTRRAGRLARQQIEFVAGVSHELRTPLSVINSAAENLSDGVISDPGQVRRYGALIAGEGRRLNEMVDQVMTFAGLQAGRNLAERQTVGVEELIDRSLKASAALIGERHVNVEKRVAPGLPPVLVDPAAMQRSLQNLIENAVKYGDGAAWLRVSADVDADSGARRSVAISVEDHGPGIALDEQRHVFEPFYRGRDVVASTIRGSGLGLSLVKRIVEAHGGRVAVKSAPGRGTSFVIHLPCGREPVS